MLFGNEAGTLKDLVFEKATDIAALSCFKCGVAIVDAIIRTELKDCLPTNDLFLVKDGEEIVALFCIG